MHFCFTIIRLHDLRAARKDPEKVDVENLEEALVNYAIPFLSFMDLIRQDLPEEKDDDDLELHHLQVFYLLVANRTFLLPFNLALAQFRQQRGDSPSLRCSIPHWVKRAVYFRENGKCALCKKDLSGLIARSSRNNCCSKNSSQ